MRKIKKEKNLSVKQRGSSWEAYVRKGNERYRKSFKSKEEADTWEAMAKYHISIGMPIEIKATSQGEWTLRRAGDETYKSYWASGRSRHTMLYNMNMVCKHLGEKTLVSSITSETLNKYMLESRASGKKNSTINRRLCCISKILHHAKDCGYLTSLPKVPLQKEDNGKIRWITKEEEFEIRNHFVSVGGVIEMAQLFTVAVDTGMRRSELLNLKVGDISPGKIHIWETKANVPRSIPMTKRIKGQLSVMMYDKKSTDHIFTLRVHQIRSAWDRMKNTLGLQDLRFHDTRHTFASRLVQRGVPIPEVQQLLGHQDIQMTMRYAHLAPKNLSNAIKVLEA